MPQGFVLGPLLFAIYCDDLPSCAEIEGKNIEMYADYTTLYCISNTVDQVAELLNTVLTRKNDWSHKNVMTVHPDKSEAMIIKTGTFIGPLPSLWLNGNTVKWVKSSRVLGLNLDMCLKWREHIEELQLSYAKKLNLLKAMRFLPRQMLNDFYWKVVYPAVTYGIVIWGNCNATQKK